VLGDCAVKINDVIKEAVNPSTGTPQGEPADVNRADVPAYLRKQQGQKPLTPSEIGASTTQKAEPIQPAEPIPRATRFSKPAQQDPKIELAKKTWIDEWKKEVRANPTAAKDPDALQKYATQLARDKTGNQLFTPEPPPGMAPAQVAEYIGAVVEKTLSATSAPVKQAQSDIHARETKQIINTLIAQAEQSNDRIGYSDINKVLTDNGAITANMEPLERRQTITNIAAMLKQQGIEITQGPNGTAPGVGPQLSPGIGIISSDPLVLSYDKRKYALNRSNQWVVFGSTKTASPEMTEFLNKQLRAM